MFHLQKYQTEYVNVKVPPLVSFTDWVTVLSLLPSQFVEIQSIVNLWLFYEIFTQLYGFLEIDNFTYDSHEILLGFFV